MLKIFILNMLFLPSNLLVASDNVGVPFLDIKKFNKEDFYIDSDWSSSFPDWRIHSFGSNIEGTCTNTNCVASKKNVICPVGYGIFLIIDKGVYNEKIKCPMCNKKITPTTVAFNRCHYKMKGRRSLVSGTEDIAWTTIGNKCRIYRVPEVQERYSSFKVESVDGSKKKPEDDPF